MLARIELSISVLAVLAGSLAAQQPCFDGTGGPNGNFDWVVRSGETWIFDTTLTPILGGPGGAPTTVQDCVDGLVDLRHLTIEEGGEIRVQGPNPLHILATGDVIIRGSLDLSGFSGRDVVTLNTGHQVEFGGAGAAGGGRGGNANIVTTSSSPRGGRGQGPFGIPDAGGQGGETGYAPANLGKDARRPGGGGGGRFAQDWIGTTLPQGGSVAATAGTDGHPSSHGADPNDGHAPAHGGLPGEGPFTDGKPANDYLGLRPIVRGGQLLALLRGELPVLWAGYGGGGGGNADPAGVFPTPNWNLASDEKGGAGGGGGGALHVQALGRIVFGIGGEIVSRGGRGGLGENTNFIDHVGGTGGSGSGGHIVLESASEVDFTDGGATVNVNARDWLSAVGQPRRSGASQYVDPCCRHLSNGGAGGAGVIQIHVPNPLAPPGTNPATTDIVVPFSLAARSSPLDQLASPPAWELFPTCDPFPRQGSGRLGAAGGRRWAFLRYALTSAHSFALDPDEGESALEFDLSELELPRF